MDGTTTDYERAVAELVTETRDSVTLLRVELGSGPPGPHADYIASALNGLRRTLAAVELNLETIAAARVLGRDEGFGHGFARGHACGRRAAEAGRGKAAVIPLRAPRAITA